MPNVTLDVLKANKEGVPWSPFLLRIFTWAYFIRAYNLLLDCSLCTLLSQSGQPGGPPRDAHRGPGPAHEASEHRGGWGSQASLVMGRVESGLLGPTLLFLHIRVQVSPAVLGKREVPFPYVSLDVPFGFRALFSSTWTMSDVLMGAV